MNFFEAIILGIVQGLTEFIPVSSSGHLVLLHDAFNITESGLLFDVALHLGTLMALIIFFRKVIWNLLLGLLGKNDSKRLAWLLILATLPAVLAGMWLQDSAETTFRSTRLVAIGLIIVALLMLIAEKLAAKNNHPTKLEKVSVSQSLTMGFAQAVALIPGVSRSGITITVGLFSGLDRVAATRFSFLLAIPITIGAMIKLAILDNGLSTISADVGIFVVGILAAFASGLFAIGWLLKFLANHSLAVFAYYRIVLGLLVLLLAI